MNSPLRDDPLVRKVIETLDQQAAAPDAELDRRVHEALRGRHAPVIAQYRGRWAMGGLALAAGVSVLLMLPPSILPWRPAPTPVVHIQPPTVDPEFLDDMELIATLGEDPDET
ncbi:MAG TPA: hypothetical protein VFW42_04605 [Fluviicoccus sp.]|nr:hypothetical protein [Fluviicoccus sp.]